VDGAHVGNQCARFQQRKHLNGIQRGPALLLLLLLHFNGM
jgi:hypothetical protein